MKHIVLDNVSHRRLPFFLALEEWVAASLPPDEYFFTWQVDPTVICGRNQQIGVEVDLEFCRSRGIEVYRRKSGGGAVFADRNNIMFSYITPEINVSDSFSRYTGIVAGMLRSLGIAAEAGGRNDILINGCKVAGNAFYHTSCGSIVHGTMLYDTDPELMSGALTPAKAKLESNKVKSVSSRITTLVAQGLDMTCESFRRYAIEHIVDGEVRIPATSLPEIEEIQKSYLTATHILGRRSSLPVNYTVRTRQAGGFEVAYAVDSDNRIIEMSLSGDFFPLCDIDTALIMPLIGVKRTPDAIIEVLRRLGVEHIIAGADPTTLTEVLTK